MEPLIHLRRVSRSFGSLEVLREISLGLFRGETLALVGESGCGKSVTTKLMAALTEPSRGEVLWSGQPVAEMPRETMRLARQRLGYLFQGAALFDSLSVFENVAFGLVENGGHIKSEIEDVVHDHLRHVGLPAAAALKRPSELSGGMRKRVGLARALAVSPEIMIYDEPTTGLDPIMSDVINELIIKTANDRQMTSVVVTHDMNTVRRVATRVIMLSPVSRLGPGESQVLFAGPTQEIFEVDDPVIRDFVTGNAERRLEELAA